MLNTSTDAVLGTAAPVVMPSVVSLLFCLKTCTLYSSTDLGAYPIVMLFSPAGR